MSMKTIIVTGFGPFRDYKINASWEAVKLLPDEIDECKLVKTEIPVVYDTVETKIPALWKEHSPEFVIHVGVSSLTAEIKIEKKAYRVGYSEADSMGNYRSTQSVCCTGAECISTGVNVEKVCKRINQTGIVKASTSDCAGRYLCEFIYYTSLNIDRNKVLFVHVPPLEKPYSAAELSKGLQIIIKSILGKLEVAESDYEICNDEDY